MKGIKNRLLTFIISLSQLTTLRLVLTLNTYHIQVPTLRPQFQTPGFEKLIFKDFKMYPTVLILSLLSTVMAVPTPDTASYKNMLVPNEHGELVYATPQQIEAHMANGDAHHTLSKRDDCDAEDSQNAQRTSCAQFCERAVSDITGDIVKSKS
jgi:hypothetical protein